MSDSQEGQSSRDRISRAGKPSRFAPHKGSNVRSRSPGCKTLYVSDLPSSWNWQRIKAFLNEHEILCVLFIEVVENKSASKLGSCLIDFENSQSCKNGLRTLRDKEVEGRKIFVKEDISGNLKEQLSKTSAARKIKEFVEQADMRRQGNTNFGNNISHGSVNFGNNPLHSNTSFGNNKEPAAPSKPVTYGLNIGFLESLGVHPPLVNWVTVKNLDLDVDSAKLKEIFKLAGKVKYIEIKTATRSDGRAMAIVEYNHPVEAIQAISMLDNQQLYGSVMSVRMGTFEKNVRQLPEGLKGIGMGLGSEGKPLDDVIKFLQEQEDSDKAKDTSSVVASNENRNSQFSAENYGMIAQSNPLNPGNLNPGLNLPFSRNSPSNLTQILANQHRPDTMGSNANSNLNSDTLNITSNMGVNSLNLVPNQQAVWTIAPGQMMNPNALTGLPGTGNGTYGNNSQPLNIVSGNINNAQSLMGLQAFTNLQAQMQQQGIPRADIANTLAAYSGQAMGVNALGLPFGAGNSNNEGNYGQNMINSGNESKSSKQDDLMNRMDRSCIERPNRTERPNMMERPSMVERPTMVERPMMVAMVERPTMVERPPIMERSSLSDYINQEASSRTSDMIVVERLPLNVTLTILHEKMLEAGEIRFIEMTAPGSAIIRYHNEWEAQRAIKMFNKTRVDGNPIEVHFF